MNNTNFEPVRERMIYHQIRTCDVVDPGTLDTFARVHREDYVPEQFRSVAFADTFIPLPCGQVMLKPMLEGKLLQALQPQANDHALVVGTGSGYLTACVAAVSDHVTSIDIHVELLDAAAAIFADQKVRNVELRDANLNRFEPGTTFDRILLTGSMPLFDARLPEWLNDGGLMICITGTAPSMKVERITRSGDTYTRTSLFETVVPEFAHMPQPDSFGF